MKWVDVSTHAAAGGALILVNDKKSIVARVWEDPDGMPDAEGWWGGLYNKAGALTPLIPKPYASKEIAKQMVEEAVKNTQEVRG